MNGLSPISDDFQALLLLFCLQLSAVLIRWNEFSSNTVIKSHISLILFAIAFLYSLILYDFYLRVIRSSLSRASRFTQPWTYGFNYFSHLVSHICCSCLRYLECLFCLPVLGYLQANMCTIVISVFIVFIISCPFFALRFWQRSLGFSSHTVLHPVEWQYLCLAFFWSSMTLLVLCMRFGLLI